MRPEQHIDLYMGQRGGRFVERDHADVGDQGAHDLDDCRCRVTASRRARSAIARCEPVPRKVLTRPRVQAASVDDVRSASSSPPT